MRRLTKIGFVALTALFILNISSCLITFYPGDYDYGHPRPPYEYPDDDDYPTPPNRPSDRPNHPSDYPNEKPNRPNDNPFDYPYEERYTITYKLNGGINSKSNPSSYTSRSQTIKLADPSRDGYTFGGWYTDSNFRNRKTEIQSGSSGDLVLYAKWISATTSYKVEHYQQNLYDNKYTLFQTESKTGKVDAKTAAASKNYPGFTAQKINQEIISKHGNTVVKIYYDRKIVDVTINLDGGTTRTTLYSGKISGKYGAPLYVENPTRKGYTFSGWTPSMPSTFPANSATYKAKWTAKTSSPEPEKPHRPPFPIFLNQD